MLIVALALTIGTLLYLYAALTSARCAIKASHGEMALPPAYYWDQAWRIGKYCIILAVFSAVAWTIWVL